MSKNKRSNISQFSFDSALLLAVITSIFYLVGIVYYNGFLSGINLNHQKMEIGFHLIMYHGFIQLAGHIWGFILLTFLIFPIIYGVITVYLLTIIKCRILRVPIRWHRRYLISNKNKNTIFIRFLNSSNRFKCINSGIDRALPLVGLLLLFVSVFLITIYLFERQGIKDGEYYIDSLVNSDDSNLNKIAVVIQKEKKELTHILCGSQNCASIDTKTKEIFYYPQSLPYSFIYNSKNK